MKLSKLIFTIQITITDKRRYAYILLYTPTPTTTLHPVLKCIWPPTGQLSAFAFRILPTVPQ